MSAVHALKLARSAGIRIGIDGDALTLDANTAPPSDVLELLVLHKAQVIALLRTGRDGWSGDDWRTFFDERAGIAEFDGGLPRHEAEARAFACCVAEWPTAIRRARRPAAASAAAKPNTGKTRCFPSAPRRPGMPGCIRPAGPHGTPAARRKPSPPFQPSESMR
jgi:hypothetical protein